MQSCTRRFEAGGLGATLGLGLLLLGVSACAPAADRDSQDTNATPAPSEVAGKPVPPPRQAEVPRPAPAGNPPPRQAPPPAYHPPARPSAPAPRPVSVQREVPAGTALDLELLGDLSSGTSVAGDVFRARVVNDVVVDGAVAIPAGATVEGKVTEVVPLKKIGGTPGITLQFERLVLAGAEVPLQATLHDVGKSQGVRDAAKIGGGALAGAVLGHQIDKKKGKILGAVVGGAIGTAVAAKTGKEVELPAGTQVAIELEQSVRIPAEP